MPDGIAAHFLAGAGAGVVKLCCTAPLDTVKVHMQLGQGSAAVRAAVDGGGRAAAPGVLATGAAILRLEGVRGLYFGFSAGAAQQMGKVGLQFALFEHCRRSIRRALGGGGAHGGKQSSALSPGAVNFVSGFSAGALEAVLWTTPTERLKTLRQAQIGHGRGGGGGGGGGGPTAAQQRTAPPGSSSTYRALVDAVRAAEGGGVVGPLRGLWRGAGATAARQASNLGVRFFTYNEIKDRIVRARGGDAAAAGDGTKKKRKVKTLDAAAAGSLAGAISSLANNPVDVLKSRMQAAVRHHDGGGAGGGGGGGGGRPGYAALLRDVLREDGARGLYRGVVPRVAKISAGQGVVFLVYEKIVGLSQALVGGGLGDDDDVR